MTGAEGPQRLEVLAPEGAGRLDRFLAEVVEGLSRARIQDLIREGFIRVEDRLERPSRVLKGGERVTVEIPPPRPSGLEAQDIPLDILYEDDHVVVLDKAAGMVVHPAAGHWNGTLVHALLHALPDLEGVGGEERPGLVHRLDKGTSGVMVIARNDGALHHLQAQFSVHSVERRYLALVVGVPKREGGRIESSLGRHPGDRQRFCSVPQGGRRAVTFWRRVAVGPGLSLVACRLETGRTHQVRVHLSEAGHPVLGDPVYGRNRQPPVVQGIVPDHQLLHAGHLGFVHPATGAWMRFDSAPPPDFLACCQAAGLQVPPHLGELPFPVGGP